MKKPELYTSIYLLIKEFNNVINKKPTERYSYKFTRCNINRYIIRSSLLSTNYSICGEYQEQYLKSVYMICSLYEYVAMHVKTGN